MASDQQDLNLALTLVDTTAIQQYIFNSNTLKHIMGGSGLVHTALHDWLKDALVLCGKNNLTGSGEIDANLQIESDFLDGELIYRGGGNALIIFCSLQKAKKFTTILTEKLLKDAPGLDIVISHLDLPSSVLAVGGIGIGGYIQELFRKVNQKKMDRKRSLPLPGLGVTAACGYTQKPATKKLDDELVSGEIYQKVKAGFEYSKNGFDRKFAESRKDYEFILNFSEFGGEGKGSYMAVVHADGTGMGQRLMDLLERNKDQPSRATLQSLRAFSASISGAVQSSMDEMINYLRNGVASGTIDLPWDKQMLPFRPIVCEGDDITFVCWGKLGLTLTSQLFQAMAKIPLTDGEGPIAARAGVAIVKANFPFSQAYTLANELNHSARQFAIEVKKVRNLPQPPMAMDWHISTDGTLGRLEVIRRRYRGINVDLLMRPLVMGDSRYHWRSWENFEKIMEEFLSGTAWKNQGSKLRALQDEYIKGSNAVEKYRRVYNLPSLPNVVANTNGFVGNTALCFDALETLDFYANG